VPGSSKRAGLAPGATNSLALFSLALLFIRTRVNEIDSLSPRSARKHSRARQNLSLGMVEMNNSAPFLAVYRVKGTIRTAALATLATGLIFSAGIVSRVKLGLQQPSAETALMISLVMLCSVIFALHTFTSTVRLTVDSVEKRYLLTIASLAFSEIRGRRQIGPHGDQANLRFYVIVPTHRSLPTIKFGEYHEFDDAFYEWFMGLPDLDAKAK
jgi:hypothetical protein